VTALSPAKRRPNVDDQQVPDGWEAAYLARLTETGARMASARDVGIRWRDVTRRMRADAEFEEQVHEAIDLYADSLEKRLTTETSKSNVVGLIVRLKALRPASYIERTVTANLNVSTEARVTPAQAQALLRDMVCDARPEVLAMLAGEATTAHVGPGPRPELDS
jgi:hypothetical protein